jgi:chromosome segregation ATPase
MERPYEEAESRTAKAFEQLVSRDSFGELLARVTENVVAVTKISTDVFDLWLRNLRLAGRQDITKLARQLARTEDKLELVLQEVEHLQDDRERLLDEREHFETERERFESERERFESERPSGRARAPAERRPRANGGARDENSSTSSAPTPDTAPDTASPGTK